MPSGSGRRSSPPSQTKRPRPLRDARYLRDLLQRMAQAPVFLDSSDLADLKRLFTDGVQQSDVLVVLGTKGVLTRPWCLLELWESVKVGILLLTTTTNYYYYYHVY